MIEIMKIDRTVVVYIKAQRENGRLYKGCCNKQTWKAVTANKEDRQYYQESLRRRGRKTGRNGRYRSHGLDKSLEGHQHVVKA
jgi:hypothetical protein